MTREGVDGTLPVDDMDVQFAAFGYRRGSYHMVCAPLWFFIALSGVVAGAAASF